MDPASNAKLVSQFSRSKKSHILIQDFIFKASFLDAPDESL